MNKRTHMSKTFDDHYAEVPDNMDDVSKWKRCPCPTCGAMAEMRWTGLRTVAATGDENHAEKQWRPPVYDAPHDGPFCVCEEVVLPGDQTRWFAKDPTSGIVVGDGWESEEGPAEVCRALNAAYWLGVMREKERDCGD